MTESGQRPGNNRQFSGPVERLDEQGRQQANGQVNEQTQQRPAQMEPEVEQIFLVDHAGYTR
jgi:hypothetical protein